MATKPMTTFMTEDWLVLKAPSTDQVEAVLAWLAERSLNVIDSLDTEAIFTKSGRGKSVAALALRLEPEQHNKDAIAKMQAAYPAPKSITGLKLTDHEVTDHMDAVTADAIQHAEAAIAATAADLSQPEPTPLGAGTAVSADDNHEVTDLVIPGTQLTEGDLEIINQENAIGGEPEFTREDAIAAAQELTPDDRALAQARQAINVGGPMPSVVPASSTADDVPF